MTTLPADAHVHSEWSWDYASDPASRGSMDRICERAVRIGLPAVVFTEHLDFDGRARGVPSSHRRVPPKAAAHNVAQRPSRRTHNAASEQAQPTREAKGRNSDPLYARSRPKPEVGLPPALSVTAKSRTCSPGVATDPARRGRRGVPPGLPRTSEKAARDKRAGLGLAPSLIGHPPLSDQVRSAVFQTVPLGADQQMQAGAATE